MPPSPITLCASKMSELITVMGGHLDRHKGHFEGPPEVGVSYVTALSSGIPLVGIHRSNVPAALTQAGVYKTQKSACSLMAQHGGGGWRTAIGAPKSTINIARNPNLIHKQCRLFCFFVLKCFCVQNWGLNAIMRSHAGLIIRH